MIYRSIYSSFNPYIYRAFFGVTVLLVLPCPQTRINTAFFGNTIGNTNVLLLRKRQLHLLIFQMYKPIMVNFCPVTHVFCSIRIYVYRFI